MNLAEMTAGERGKVVSMDLTGDAQRRLMEMGLTRGTAFQVVRFAPMGDPIELRLRGYHLSLRKSEAAGITVERAA